MSYYKERDWSSDHLIISQSALRKKRKGGKKNNHTELLWKFGFNAICSFAISRDNMTSNKGGQDLTQLTQPCSDAAMQWRSYFVSKVEIEEREKIRSIEIRKLSAFVLSGLNLSHYWKEVNTPFLPPRDKADKSKSTLNIEHWTFLSTSLMMKLRCWRFRALNPKRLIAWTEDCFFSFGLFFNFPMLWRQDFVTNYVLWLKYFFFLFAQEKVGLGFDF